MLDFSIKEGDHHHKHRGKEGTVRSDPPLGRRQPNWGCEYGLNYRSLPDTVSSDGDELDAYISV